MVRIALALQVLALVAVGVAHLALTDISHGESDLRLEWQVLQVAGAVILTAAVFSIETLRRVRRRALPRNG